MRNPITITPLQKTDKKTAKIMEDMFNYEWKQGGYEDIAGALVNVKVYIEAVHGINLPMSIFNKVVKAVVERDIEKLKK